MTPQPPTDPAAAADAQELPIGQILSIFWRGRWIILGCTVLAGVAGYVHVEQRGTIWRAASRVYVEKSTPSAVGPESLLLGISAKNYANTQAEVMQSTDVLVEALGRFRREFAQPELFGEDSTNHIAWLKKNLTVKVGRDDDIITVSLDSAKNEEACAVVNCIVDSYQAFQAKRQKSTAKDLYKLLEKDRDFFSDEYEAAIDAQIQFRKDHPGVGGQSGGLSVLRETWRTLSGELAGAENDLLAHEAAWTAAKGLQADPALLRQVLPSLAAGPGSGSLYPPSVQAIHQQLFQFERDRADLLVELQPEHPRVKNVDAAIERLQARLAEQDQQFATAYVEALHQRVLAARQKRDSLLASVADVEKKVYELDALDAQNQKLLGRVAQAQASLEVVRERFTKINTDTDAEMAFVHILDYANPDTIEVASGKAMRLAAALLLGVFAGAALAWLRGLLDQRLRNADEVRQGLQMSILAVLPRQRRDVVRAEGSAVAKWDLDAHYAEAARSLRTAVYFGMVEGEGNLVQVTSPDAADGKTTIAASLAIAMAKAGQRTLLIDADLRKPRQAERFGLSDEHGLSTALAADVAVESLVQHTDLDGLDVLTSGPVPANPAEVLGSARFGRLLEQLSKQYDRVIVDSPPVLPVTDARIIASRCSVTLLALRVDKTTRKRAAAARDSLVGAGAKILGVALNDMPAGIGYGYGYGYGGYGYGEGKRRASVVPNGVAEGLAGVRVPRGAPVKEAR